MTNRLAFVFFFLLSCFSLDPFLFEPSKVEEYSKPDSIPDTFIQPLVLTSLGNNKIYGFFIKSNGLDSIKNQVTIIYCHGKDENINRYWDRVKLLWKIGYKVLIFDYQGYGKSEGSPSAAACYADGEAVLKYCLNPDPDIDIDSTKIVYYGWSLGSFIATHLASDIRRPLALILETPPASATAITKEGTLLNIPGCYVVKADFDNEKRITKVESPILIIYGKNDDTAVPERHAEVLIDLLEKANKDFESYGAEANHDNIPEKMGDEYGRIINDFIIKIFNE